MRVRTSKCPALKIYWYNITAFPASVLRLVLHPEGHLLRCVCHVGGGDGLEMERSEKQKERSNITPALNARYSVLILILLLIPSYTCGRVWSCCK